MKKILPAILTILVSFAVYAANDEEKAMMKDHTIAESTVMLYYSNLDAPRKFYRDLLGLEASYEDDWVSIYKLTPNSAVGLVLEGGTAYHKARKDNAVMLSLTVDNVDAWYGKLTKAGELKILIDIYNHEKAPIRAFLVEDPGGYSVEVFQWLK